LPTPYECADEEGVDRHQVLDAVDFYLMLLILRAEVIEQVNMLIIELNRLFTIDATWNEH
jgi:hypothetical protein